MTWRVCCRLPIVAAVFAAFLLGARPAQADWLFTPFLGYTFKGSTTLVDLEDASGKVHFNWGGAVTLLGNGPLGVEAYFVYTPGFFQQDEPTSVIVVDSRSYALMGNLVLTTPRRWSEYGLRPFISGGFGVINASQSDIADVYPVSENLFGFNVGGGATGFFTDRTGVRFDLRFFNTLQNPEESGSSFGTARLRYWTGSVGLVLRY